MLSILIRTVFPFAASLALVVAQSQGTDDEPRVSVAVDGNGFFSVPATQAATPGADALFARPRTDLQDPIIDPGIEAESKGLLSDDDNEVAASLLPVTRRADGGSTGYWDTPSSTSEEVTEPADHSMGGNWDTPSSASEEGTKVEDESEGSNRDTQSSASEEGTNVENESEGSHRDTLSSASEEASGAADDSSSSYWDAPSSGSKEVTRSADDSSSRDRDAPSSASEEVSGVHGQSHGARDAAKSEEEVAAAPSDEVASQRHKFHKATGIYRVSEIENNRHHEEADDPDIIDWTAIPKNEPKWEEKERKQNSTGSKSKEGSLNHRHQKSHPGRHAGHETADASESEGELGRIRHKLHKRHNESHGGHEHANSSESSGEEGLDHHKHRKRHGGHHNGQENADAVGSAGGKHKHRKGRREHGGGHEHATALGSSGDGHEHRRGHHERDDGHDAVRSSGEEHKHRRGHHGRNDGHNHANEVGSSGEEGLNHHKHRKRHGVHHNGQENADAVGSAGGEHKHRNGRREHGGGHKHATALGSSGEEHKHRRGHHGRDDGHNHTNEVGSVHLGHGHLNHHQRKSPTQEGSTDEYNPEALPELTGSGELTWWRYNETESTQKALDSSKGFEQNQKRPMAFAQADTYYVLRHKSGACLTSAGDMLAVTWSCDSNSSKQLFKMEQIGKSGQFMLKQKGGKCLIPGFKKVTLSAECDPKTAALKKTAAAENKDDGFVFRNARNNKCISFKPDNSMPAEGSKLHETWYHCNKKRWERRAFALVLEGQSIEVKHWNRTQGRSFGALAKLKNQKVQCLASQVLSAWTVEAVWWKGKFHIDYTCFTPAGGLGACSTKKTKETFGKTNVRELEKHKVSCEKGSALQHWQVNVLSGTYIQVEYTCCQLQAGIDNSKCVEGKTLEKWDPRAMTQNLDGSMLQCEDGQAMSSWHFAKQKKNHVLFDYECCPLQAPSAKLPAPTPVQAPASTPSKAPSAKLPAPTPVQAPASTPSKAPSAKLPAPTPVQAPASTPSKASSGGFSIKSLDPEPPGETKNRTKNNKQKENHEQGKSDVKKTHDGNDKAGKKNKKARKKKGVYLQKIYESLKKIRNKLKKGEQESSNKETPKNKSKVVKIIINTQPMTKAKIKAKNDLLAMISDELEKIPANERREHIKELMRSARIHRDEEEEEDTPPEKNEENSTDESENITSTNETGHASQSNGSFSIKSLDGPVTHSDAPATNDEEVIDRLKKAAKEAEEALEQYKKAPQGKALKVKDPTTAQNKLIDDLKNATTHAEDMIKRLSFNEPQVNSTTDPHEKETNNELPKRGLLWDDWGSPAQNATQWSSWTFEKPKKKRSFSDVRLMHRLGSHWQRTMGEQ